MNSDALLFLAALVGSLLTMGVFNVYRMLFTRWMPFATWTGTMTHGTSAWQQGADAARAGLPASACPYPATTYHFVTWHNGWAAATHQKAKEDDEL